MEGTELKTEGDRGKNKKDTVGHGKSKQKHNKT